MSKRVNFLKRVRHRHGGAARAWQGMMTGRGSSLAYIADVALTDWGGGQTSAALTLFDESTASTSRERGTCSPVRVQDRVLHPTAVFDTYWRFAAARQAIYLARLRQEPSPSSQDAILRNHRFTNVFRASDRISQFLISSVQRGPGSSCEPNDLVFRTLLFKVFNRQDTWRHIESRVGPVRWSTYDFGAYRRALDEAAERGPIYSAAYLMPPPHLGEDRKHANHLRLLESMMEDGFVAKLLSSPTLKSVFERLASYPGLGPFLAFQYAIDLNYSEVLQFDEDDFVVAGPGAKDGIRKCFGREATGIEADVIQYMVDNQEQHFDRLGVSFPGLFGRRLHLIDAQNLFCEVDKYARVRHPEVAGISGRSRIKQKFRVAGPLATPAFPERWGLNSAVAANLSILDDFDGSTVEVHAQSAPSVVAQVSPRRVARQDCLLPF